MTEDLEHIDLAVASVETVPARCRVTRASNGSLYAEIWTEEQLTPVQTWNYTMVKLPWPT